MSIIVREIYVALKEAGATEPSALAAAQAVVAMEHAATKADIADLRATIAEAKTSIVMWVVTSQIALGAILLTAMRWLR